jgi:hypothetical protein
LPQVLKLIKAGCVDTAGGTTKLFRAKLKMVIGKKEKTAIYENHQIHISARDDIPILLGRNPIFEDYEITFKNKKSIIIRFLGIKKEPTTAKVIKIKEIMPKRSEGPLKSPFIKPKNRLENEFIVLF